MSSRWRRSQCSCCCRRRGRRGRWGMSGCRSWCRSKCRCGSRSKRRRGCWARRVSSCSGRGGGKRRARCCRRRWRWRCCSGRWRRCWSGRRCAEDVYALRELRGFNWIAGAIQSRCCRGCNRVSRWERKSQRTEVHSTISSRCYYGRAEEMLPLTEPARIALCVREKLQAIHGARHAVQHSRKHDVAIAKRCR